MILSVATCTVGHRPKVWPAHLFRCFLPSIDAREDDNFGPQCFSVVLQSRDTYAAPDGPRCARKRKPIIVVGKEVDYQMWGAVDHGRANSPISLSSTRVTTVPSRANALVNLASFFRSFRQRFADRICLSNVLPSKSAVPFKSTP